jgi:hypothetical protein
MEQDSRDVIFEAVEACLDAQLRAVRRLRKGKPPPREAPPKKRMSQVDMAYDILKRTGRPLHVTPLLERIDAHFGVKVDRESLVSSLTKKVMRGDRFVRTDRNTFGLRQEEEK